MGLASSSVPIHLLRGALGLALAVIAVAGIAFVGPLTLLLLIGTALAWRGCPTCWAVGLAMTVAERERAGGTCRSGHCARPSV